MSYSSYLAQVDQVDQVDQVGVAILSPGALEVGQAGSFSYLNPVGAAVLVLQMVEGVDQAGYSSSSCRFQVVAVEVNLAPTIFLNAFSPLLLFLLFLIFSSFLMLLLGPLDAFQLFFSARQRQLPAAKIVRALPRP